MAQLCEPFAPPPRRRLNLAAGIVLQSDTRSGAELLFVSGAGNIRLNRHALAILELCDGSRSRERVVMDALLRSTGTMRPAEVADFLDAVQARGWIVECG